MTRQRVAVRTETGGVAVSSFGSETPDSAPRHPDDLAAREIDDEPRRIRPEDAADDYVPSAPGISKDPPV